MYFISVCVILFHTVPNVNRSSLELNVNVYLSVQFSLAEGPKYLKLFLDDLDGHFLLREEGGELSLEQVM